MAPGKVLGAMLGLMLGLWIGGPWAIVLLTFFGGVAGHLYDNSHALPEPSPLEGLEDGRFPEPPPEPMTREQLDDQAREYEANQEAGHTEYARLGLTPGASDAEVKRAYRQLAAAHHPDRVAHLGPGAVKQATLRFQELQGAYKTIQRLRGL